MLCVVVLRRAHSTQRRNNRKQQFPCAVTAAGVSPMPETATFGKKRKKSQKHCFFSVAVPLPPSAIVHRKKPSWTENKKNIVHRSTAGLSPSITTTTITTTTTLPPTTTTTTNHQPTNQPGVVIHLLRLFVSALGGRRHTSNQSPKTKFATVRKKCHPQLATTTSLWPPPIAMQIIKKNNKRNRHTVILSTGASLHLTTIDCLPDCSSFRDRRFYSATTTSITATATSTTTATATTRRHHLGTCVIRNNNWTRESCRREIFSTFDSSNEMITQNKRNDHLLHTIPPPPTNQPPVHVHIGISPIFKDFLSLSLFFILYIYLFFLLCYNSYFKFVIVSVRSSVWFHEQLMRFVEAV